MTGKSANRAHAAKFKPLNLSSAANEMGGHFGLTPKKKDVLESDSFRRVYVLRENRNFLELFPILEGGMATTGHTRSDARKRRTREAKMGNRENNLERRDVVSLGSYKFWGKREEKKKSKKETKKSGGEM